MFIPSPDIIKKLKYFFGHLYIEQNSTKQWLAGGARARRLNLSRSVAPALAGVTPLIADTLPVRKLEYKRKTEM